jgi:hypothetical protein
MQHINQDVYPGDDLNLQAVFGRIDLADHSWRLMAYFADPTKRCTASIALGAFAAQAVHLSWRNMTVRDMINGAIRILETEWTTYRVKPKIVRTHTTPGPLVVFPNEDVLTMHNTSLRYKQISTMRCTWLCCDLRGDGFIGETFGVVLSLEEDNWEYLFFHIRGNAKEGEECRM